MPTELEDIVARLRNQVLRGDQTGLSPADQEIVSRDLMWLAADEIERLRALVASFQAQIPT